MAFQDLLAQLGRTHVQEIEGLRQKYEFKLSKALKENQRLQEEIGRLGGIHEGLVALEDLEVTHEKQKRFDILPGWKRPIVSDAGFALDCIRVHTNKHGRSWSEGEVPGRKPAKRSCVILPGSTFRLIWDSAGLVLISYDLLTIPFNQAFQPRGSLASVCLDWITLLFWTSDMIQGFFVGYFDKGEVVVNHQKIIRNYVKSWLLIDLVVVVPEWLTMFVLWGATDSESAETHVGTFGKFAKFARVARVLRLLRLLKMKKLLNIMADRIESEYAFILFNLIQLLCFVLVLNHVIACGWYFVGRYNMARGGDNWVTIGKVNGTRTSYLYVTSLHWSLTQFTPASMDISARNFAERVFSIVVLLFAMLVFSSIVASITASMTALRNLLGDEMRQFWLLRRYLRQRSIPSGLSSRIIKFLEHRCRVQGRLVQKEKVPVLLGLSEALQNELTHELHSAELVAHPFFEHLNSEMTGVMHRFCRLALQLQCFADREIIFSVGDEARKMFFVKGGEFEYTDLTGNELEPALRLKEWLSEAVLFTDWRHKGDLMACTEAELISVDPAQYMSVMSVHPRPWHYARTYATKFIEFLNRENPVNLKDIIRHPLLYREAVLNSDQGHHSVSTEAESETTSPQASSLASQVSDESRGVSLATSPCSQGHNHSHVSAVTDSNHHICSQGCSISSNNLHHRYSAAAGGPAPALLSSGSTTAAATLKGRPAGVRGWQSLCLPY